MESRNENRQSSWYRISDFDPPEHVKGYACSKANSNIRALTLFRICINFVVLFLFHSLCMSLVFFQPHRWKPIFPKASQLFVFPPPKKIEIGCLTRVSKREMFRSLWVRQYPFIRWLALCSAHTYINVFVFDTLFLALGDCIFKILFSSSFFQLLFWFIFACCFRMQFAHDKSEFRYIPSETWAWPCHHHSSLAAVCWECASMRRGR